MPTKIRAKDLKPLEAFYTFHPGTWGHGGPDQYRHPSITIWETYGNGKYSTSLFGITGQQDRPSITAEPRSHSYAWTLDLKIEAIHKPIVARFLAALKRQGERFYAREIRTLVRALKEAKIPRCTRIEDKDGRKFVPRRYKNDAARFLAAFDLGVEV